MSTENTNTRNSVSFEPVRDELSLYKRVSQQIEQAILSGELKPGDMLPPERVMGKQFGVSRTVIREALKALELQGLLEIQQGRGAMVAVPNPNSVASSMIRYLRVEDSPMWALHELRSILEIEIAALASERRETQDLDTLTDLVAKMSEQVSSPSRYAELDLEFHRALTNSAHNPLFSLVLDPFMTLLRESRRLGATVPDAQQRSLEAHRQVLAAVRDQDPVTARAAMKEHCTLVADLLKKGMHYYKGSDTE